MYFLAFLDNIQGEFILRKSNISKVSSVVAGMLKGNVSLSVIAKCISHKQLQRYSFRQVMDRLFVIVMTDHLENTNLYNVFEYRVHYSVFIG